MEHNLLDQIEELNDMHNTLTEALAIDANAEALAWA
jgi:hypothetical protein